jgi:hypothetical protein
MLTQPLIEMSIRNLPGGEGRPEHKAASPSSLSLLSRRMWDPRRLTTLWASTACYKDSFTFYLPSIKKIILIKAGIVPLILERVSRPVKIENTKAG